MRSDGLTLGIGTGEAQEEKGDVGMEKAAGFEDGIECLPYGGKRLALIAVFSPVQRRPSLATTTPQLISLCCDLGLDWIGSNLLL
jgi:hypothetical protein